MGCGIIKFFVQATESLLNSLAGQISPVEISHLEEPIVKMDQKYNNMKDALTERCQELDTALVQCQGVQDALDSIIAWLTSAESQFRTLQKPASLVKDRLDEQLREHRALQTDVESHVSSIDSIQLSAGELISCASNARVAKKIETKLNEVKSRFEKLYDHTQERGQFLNGVARELGNFTNHAKQFTEWHEEIVAALESHEFAKFSVEEAASRMRKIAENRDANRGLFEDTVKCGKDLLNKRDVTDTANVRDTVKNVESQWRDLNHLLDEKDKLSKRRSEHLNAYGNLREQVVTWLSRMELKVSQLAQVAVDLDVLKRQNDELKPIVREYKDYASTIDKINEIGNTYDGLLKSDRPESPSKRRSSPIKRTSVTVSPRE